MVDQFEDCEDSDEEFGEAIGDIVTIDEMLLFGLRMIGFNEKQIERANDDTNCQRFKDSFGASCIVATNMWEDLLLSTIEEIHVPKNKQKLKCYLMTMHFVKRHPVESDRESRFNFGKTTVRNWTWHFAKKIQALKQIKIVWDEGQEDDIWTCSVDGTHCWINEPKHPALSQNSKHWSHKHDKAALDYEIAICLWKSQVVWINGPFPSGEFNDLKVFVLQDGLKDKLQAANKRGIADNGCVGCEELSMPNPRDPEMVRKFKSRARKRHENFNSMKKRFACLKGQFRHSEARFKTCFEAVCVICQNKLDHGCPLFDILTPSMMSHAENDDNNNDQDEMQDDNSNSFSDEEVNTDDDGYKSTDTDDKVDGNDEE